MQPEYKKIGIVEFEKFLKSSGKESYNYDGVISWYPGLAYYKLKDNQTLIINQMLDKGFAILIENEENFRNIHENEFYFDIESNNPNCYELGELFTKKMMIDSTYTNDLINENNICKELRKKLSSELEIYHQGVSLGEIIKMKCTNTKWSYLKGFGDYKSYYYPVLMVDSVVVYEPIEVFDYRNNIAKQQLSCDAEIDNIIKIILNKLMELFLSL
jgi:hypothetical protein